MEDNLGNTTIILSGGTSGLSGGDISITGTLSTDTISEKTSASGVTIDSVLLKDNTVTAHTVTAQNYAVGTTNFISASRQGNFRDVDVEDNLGNTTIILSGGTSGLSGGDISITGTLSTDTISEKTTDSGVTIESVLMRDGGATFTTDISANGGIFSTNLGVGTITPSQKLDVNGNIRLTGDISGNDASFNVVDINKLNLTNTITNSQLTNSSITIAGASTALGGSITADTIANAIGTADIKTSGDISANDASFNNIDAYSIDLNNQVIIGVILLLLVLQLIIKQDEEKLVTGLV